MHHKTTIAVLAYVLTYLHIFAPIYITTTAVLTYLHLKKKNRNKFCAK